MEAGSLSRYFSGVGAKRVTGTEVDPTVSRGHEFQGVDSFRDFIGSPAQKFRVPVQYVWLTDDEAPLVFSGEGTWYDSRRGKSHRGAEYRLYYPAAAEDVVHRTRDGDTLFLCQTRKGELLALLCQAGSSIEQQLLWLFGLEIGGRDLSQRDFREEGGRELGIAARRILELVDIEVEIASDDLLERLLKAFPKGLPPTSRFSAFARDSCEGADALADPDQTLLAWMDMEERMFMTYERHIVGERLKQGFMNGDVADVDAFISYSLGVQNRRKSRAGYALGHHVEALLHLHDVPHKREATTEKRNGPDFLFPGEEAYHDPAWPQDKLLMLGVKTSCKDRWRQVLAEADRIAEKHLLTLEPGISATQTDEMKKERLQLVLPHGLHETYRQGQRQDLMDVAGFIDLARSLTGTTGEKAGRDTLL